MISRRGLLGAAALGLALPPAEASTRLTALPKSLHALEATSAGRLGVAVLDPSSGARAGHRVDERFPLCSTFKVLAGAALLARVDAGRERLDRRVRFEPNDLVTYSPVTQHRAGGEGMSLEEICAAAITLSDNTAGNLMLAAVDGPSGLTAYARSLGDQVTRLDRIEPALNEALPGDERDTTSPAAMVADLDALLFGNALSAHAKVRLIGWLVGSMTGDARLRAGLPSGWRIGEKTGSGERGTANDIGIIWPPGRAPVLVAVYLTDSPQTMDQRNAVIAAVGRAVVAAI